MTESGGPNAQAGIHYQNAIGALYLGRMLDLARRPIHETVIKVRVEAPADVDDVHVWLADGGRRFIQAKKNVSAGTAVWQKMWRSLEKENNSTEGSEPPRLHIVLGEFSSLAQDLRECTIRAKSAESLTEYESRLNSPQLKIFDQAAQSLRQGTREAALRILANTTVEIIPEDFIGRDFAPNWMPAASVSAANLFSILRDVCAANAGSRGSFTPEQLREVLREAHEIEFFEPTDWGADLYRETIQNRAFISIPGTHFRKEIDHDFPWPDCTHFEAKRDADFDDEAFSVFYEPASNSIDMRLFPSANFDKVVLIGGAGLGKSVLTKAIAARLAAEGKLPAVLPIPEFCRSNSSIAEYLQAHINSEHGVKIDWQAASDKGRAVLILDGLDEVAPEQRRIALERLSAFSARNNAVPWLVAARDATSLNLPVSGTLIELQPLSGVRIREMIAFYHPDEPALVEAYINLLETRPDLLRLARVPLFLALLSVAEERFDDLPKSRSDILETYLAILMRPSIHKPSDTPMIATTKLRKIAEWVAHNALERDQIGVGTAQVDRAIEILDTNLDTDTVTDAFVKCGR